MSNFLSGLLVYNWKIVIHLCMQTSVLSNRSPEQIIVHTLTVSAYKWVGIKWCITWNYNKKTVQNTKEKAVYKNDNSHSPQNTGIWTNTAMSKGSTEKLHGEYDNNNNNNNNNN